jgi:hypothetical protein
MLLSWRSRYLPAENTLRCLWDGQRGDFPTALFYPGFLLRSTTFSPKIDGEALSRLWQAVQSQFSNLCVCARRGLAVKGELIMGSRRRGSGRRKVGRKKRRMRAKIRHRK